VRQAVETLPGSTNTARYRARHRRASLVLCWIAWTWLIACVIGGVLALLAVEGGIVGTAVPFVVLLTTPILFLSYLVERALERSLSHQVRRETAAPLHSAAQVLPPPTPVQFPSPTVPSADTARVRATHRQATGKMAFASLILLTAFVLMFLGIGGAYSASVMIVSVVVVMVSIVQDLKRRDSSYAAVLNAVAADREAEFQRVAAAVAAGAGPVLYMRAFADDQRAGRRFGELSEEEHLAKALAWIGPLVAIGRPGEQLPFVGAHRMYLADDEWQARVTSLMKEARLVVLRTAGSAGFRWEVITAAATVPPERVLLVVDDPRELRAVLDILVRQPDRRGSTLSLRGRRIGSVKGLVMFERDWVPHPLRLQRGWFRMRHEFGPLVGRFTLSLRPLFDRHQIAYQVPPFSAPKIGAVVALIAIVASIYF
jgi:hypothetical protein